MNEHERDALLRLQFCLNSVNFREISEFGGEALYKEYTEGAVDPVAAVFEAQVSAEEGSATQAIPKEGTPAYDKWLAQEADRQLRSHRDNKLGGDSFADKARQRRLDSDFELDQELPALSADEIIAKHVEVNDAMRRDLVTLHGAMEFIRSGNQDALPIVLKRDWRKLEGDPAIGGYAGRAWGTLTSANAMVRDGAKTWNDFLMAMTAKLPSTRRSATTSDRVQQRLASKNSRAELTASGLYGSDRTTLAVNPYAAKLVDDDFKPPSPEPWRGSLRSTNAKEVAAWDQAQREKVKTGLVTPIGIPYGKPADQGRFAETTGSATASQLLSTAAAMARSQHDGGVAAGDGT